MNLISSGNISSPALQPLHFLVFAIHSTTCLPAFPPILSPSFPFSFFLFSWSYMELDCLQGYRMTFNFGSSWFYLLSARIVGICQDAHFYEVLGAEARASYMVGKDSTNWATSPALYFNDFDFFLYSTSEWNCIIPILLRLAFFLTLKWNPCNIHNIHYRLFQKNFFQFYYWIILWTVI